MSSLNCQHDSIYKNYYKKKRGRKKRKYKWVIKNKLKNAHSKQFHRNLHDVPFVINTTLCNVFDDSGNISICSNSSSSDIIIDDDASSGGSIFSVNDDILHNDTFNFDVSSNINYLATAPAPPCDPDLIGI